MLYWYDGRDNVFGAESFDVVMSTYYYLTWSKDVPLSSGISRNICAASTDATAKGYATMCSFTLPSETTQSGATLYAFYIIAKYCTGVPVKSTWSENFSQTDVQPSSRRLSVKEQLAPAARAILSAKCDIERTNPTLLGTPGPVTSPENSTSSDATNATTSSSEVKLVPKYSRSSSCAQAGGDTSRIGDAICDKWMNVEQCSYDGKSTNE